MVTAQRFRLRGSFATHGAGLQLGVACQGRGRQVDAAGWRTDPTGGVIDFEVG